MTYVPFSMAAYREECERRDRAARDKAARGTVEVITDQRDRRGLDARPCR